MSANLAPDWEYYYHSGRLPGSSRVSQQARRRVFERFLEVMRPQPSDRVLDLGATSDAIRPESNFFERLYPYKSQVVCAGKEDASHLERLYPGTAFTRVTPGAPLPFATRHFDIVFSNAVVEHVGPPADQAAFLAEALRVARRFFIVTPNRWFPLETHTGLPLVHYCPPRVFRSLLRLTPLSYWASEQHLNLLSVRSMRRLFPAATDVTVEHSGIGFVPAASNLIAYGSTTANA